jgi:hypothetical protein
MRIIYAPVITAGAGTAMLNFIEPAPFDPLIDAAQFLWPLYRRLTGSLIRAECAPAELHKLNALREKRAILCPNHASHDDPFMMFGLSAILGEHFAYLTAREIFKIHPSPSAVWLQFLGCYSVVRAAPDIESFKAGLDLILRNERKLVIFPEGEVTHQNLHLTELQNGPEQLAISTATTLRNSGKSEPVRIVPVGLLYRYQTSISYLVNLILLGLERELLSSPPICMCTPHRLRSCFIGLLKRKLECRELGPSEGLELEGLRDRLIKSTLENVAVAEDSCVNPRLRPVENIHRLKNFLDEKRFSTRLPRVTSKDKQLYNSLKSITNLFAIGEHSFDHSVTQEEAGELLYVLEQEVYKRVSINTERVCQIAVGEPIDAAKFSIMYETDKASAIRDCKQELSSNLSETLRRLESTYPSMVTFPLCTAATD